MSERSITVANVLFEDRYGGPQKRVITVGRALTAHGVRTIVYLPDRGATTADLATQAGLQVKSLAFQRIPRPGNLPALARWLLLQFRDARRFARLYHLDRPDVVHVNGAFFLAPAIGAGTRGIPLLWHLNDTMPRRPLARLLGLLVRANADVIAVSSRAVALHYGIPFEKCSVLYPPVDVAAFGSTPRVDDGLVRVGLVANWAPVKGVEYFVEAMALVKRRVGDRLRVEFFGSRWENHAQYNRTIEAKIEALDLGKVTAHRGFVPDVSQFLGALDVLVMSSTREAFPMCVIEGMAAGVPAVATSGGAAEAILAAPEPAGIIVPPRDPEAIADAVTLLIDHPEVRSRMGEIGRRTAQSTFSVEAVAGRHLALYERAVAASAHRR